MRQVERGCRTGMTRRSCRTGGIRRGCRIKGPGEVTGEAR